MTEKEISSMIMASSHFLFEQFPDDFHKWSEKKLHKYCSNYAWKPFEFYEGEEIFEYIESLSEDILAFTKQQKE